jgi:hypothetical protein
VTSPELPDGADPTSTDPEVLSPEEPDSITILPPVAADSPAFKLMDDPIPEADAPASKVIEPEPDSASPV